MRAGRYWKIWPVLLVLDAVLVWLAQPALVKKGEMSPVAYAAAAQQPADARPVLIERPPLRFIKDPNPSLSSVTVDSKTNTVVMTDENLFQILEYDSRSNTPRQAAFTEPKRVISGTETYAEMICGSYIDPVTHEIYVTNNDTQDWLPVFGPNARGNAKPTRLLATPHRAFAVTVNQKTQELFITIQDPPAVYVYNKLASGNDAPLRVLRGPDTHLGDAHGLSLDTKNNVMYVSNFGNATVGGGGGGGGDDEGQPARRGARGDDAEAAAGRRGGGGRAGGAGRAAVAPSYGKFEPPSITVYPLDAKGNTKPLRIISGPKTTLNWAAHLAVDEERQELFVANDAENSVVVFRAGDDGDVAPIRIIKGRNTGIKNPTGLTLDSQKGEVYVTNMGTPSMSVFPMTADGDVRPVRTIRAGPANWPALMIGNPGAVGYDTKRDQILVPN